MGLRQHCERFKKVPSKQSRTGFALRCAELKKNALDAYGRRKAQSPVCDQRLVDGGRSKGLIRSGSCHRTIKSRAARTRRSSG